MRKFDLEERRARLASRHHLASPGTDVESVAADMVGLHASDPGSVFLSALARVQGFVVGDLERRLYEDRSLVRMLGMRRTMFVVPVDLAGVMDASCTKALLPGETRRLVGYLESQAIASDGQAWLDEVCERTLSALSARGQATALELREEVPELKLKIVFGEGKSWGGSVGVSTRVLFLLATAAKIVRARPLGTWLSSQYRWAPVNEWLPGGLAEMDPAEARIELARRWLRAFGPGTTTDLKWWTGWTVRNTKAALAELEAVEVDLDGEVGYVLPDDLEGPALAVPDWIALLPALDPTVMGWKERRWYLGDHQAELFDRNGNAGPTIWWNGRIVGGWSQLKDGQVATTFLEPVPAVVEDRVRAEAASVAAWLGEARIIPRFRTPLEKRLSAG